MATAQLIRPAAPLPGGVAAGVSRAPKAPSALAGAVLAVLLYAAFAHGAAGTAAEARLQVALAGLTALAAGSWLWSGTLRFRAPRLTLFGLASLALFALWSGVTLFWSVAPDDTWLELNRTITYVLVSCLAVALGASHSRSLESIGKGFLVIVVAVTLYALGQKLFPGLHVAGVFSLNQTGPLPRLQAPFGYWNALALFIVMGVPLALALAIDRLRSRRLRLSALVALQLMLVTIGFTYSRGGLLALVAALVAMFVLSKVALRALMWLAAASLAAAPPLIFGLTNHSLTSSDISLGSREGAGAVLALILLMSILVLLAGGVRLLDLEWRIHLSPQRVRTIRRGVVGALAVGLVIALIAVAASSRGVGGTASDAWKSFATARATSVTDPHRLLSADSQNRWVWWKEAAGAFSDRPIAGWGAGSFGVVHLLYRHDLLTVKQPHSVPLQWLAETGIIGALAASAALGLMLAGAVAAVRRRPLGSERLLAAGFFALVIAYLVHALYDWDWDIPGVTLPALVALGLLGGSARTSGSRALDARGLDGALEPLGSGARALAVAALTLVVAVFAASAILPSLAATKARAAEVVASGASAAALDRAAASARFAARLNPVSDAGPEAQATVALHRGNLRAARADFLQATRRQPSDYRAWVLLAGLESSLGDANAAEAAALRAAALNPVDLAQLLDVLRSIKLEQVPPKDSATATPVS